MSNQFTIEELKEILLNEGYRNTEIANENLIALKIDGKIYGLTTYPNGDIQMIYRVVFSAPLSLARINNLNSRIRFGKLFRDEDDENVLLAEATLLEGELLEYHVINLVERMKNLVQAINLADLID
ncbi:hypothetical protein [Avibacterium avium]|uniref:hypothetical protein n=1 Tax=Avibacterium avium TaxID=751 RepID=UPI003BF7C0BF